MLEWARANGCPCDTNTSAEADLDAEIREAMAELESAGGDPHAAELGLSEVPQWARESAQWTADGAARAIADCEAEAVEEPTTPTLHD